MRLLLQLFIALCKALYERDQYLLTRLKGPFHSISELAGYFVLESGTVKQMHFIWLMLPNSIIYSQLYSFTSITRWIAYYGSTDKNLYIVIHEHICLFLSHF